MNRLSPCNFNLRYVAGLLCSGLLWSAAGAQTTLPSTKMGRGQLVAPSAADAFYQASSCHTYGLVDVNVCRTDLPPGYVRPVDVRSAARALGAGGFTPDQYVNNVYEFIRNGIDTEFRYGVAKGALGALIDRSGTPFDQAQLMVELLLEGGITARYKIGTIDLTPAQFTAWTTLSDAKAACRFLANGGIPAVINGSTNASCAYTGSVTSVRMSHVWIEAVVGGSNYVFDPSYKTYSRTKVLDPAAISGYSSATFLTNALVGSAQTNIGGMPGVTTLNRANIESNLTSYSQAILSTIQTSHGTATREELLGLPKLVREDLVDNGPRQSALPYPSTVSRTIELHIPDAYRTTLTLRSPLLENWQVDLLDRKLFVDEIYGERLEIVPINIRLDRDVQLRLGDRVLETFPLLNYPTGFFGPWDAVYGMDRITLGVDHPYADQGGAYMDQSSSADFTKYTSTAILFGAGKSGGKLNGRWNNEQKEDRYFPRFFRSEPEAVLGGQATQDKMKFQEGSEWLTQYSMALQALEGVADTLAHHHHSIGIIFSHVTLQVDGLTNSSKRGYVVDHALRMSFSSGLSVAHRAGNDTDTLAAERTAASIGATLEGSVGEQVTGSAEAASTHTRFVWGREFRSADSVILIPANSNVANLSQYIRATQCPPNRYEGLMVQTVTRYVEAGYNVLAHQNTCLGPGPLYDSSNLPVQYISFNRGAAFIAYKPDFSEIAHILASGEVAAKGAGAVSPPTEFEPTKASDLLSDDFKVRETLGVDMNSGAAGYTPPADISVGMGSFPYSLSVQRNFKPGSVPLGSFREGWTHNFVSNASMGSSGTEALGATRPAAMASSIAAIYVTLDQFRSANTVSAMVVPSFIQHWWHQQLVANTVSASVGASATEFVRLADGTWAPPPGQYAKLTVNGTRCQSIPAGRGSGSCSTLLPQPTNSTNLEGKSYVWNYKNLSFLVTGAGGDVQEFAYWVSTGNYNLEDSIPDGHRLANWTFPTGVAVTLSYRPDGALRTVQNSLGRSLTFNHDEYADSGRKVPYFNLLDVTDGLGRTVSYEYDPSSEVLTSVTLPDGAKWKYSYISSAPGSLPTGYPTDQRPMGFLQLHRVWEPVNAMSPALQFDYDGIWSVKSLSDAVALQIGGRSPWTYLITPGHLGEQISPTTTSYRVYFDDDSRPFRWVDEFGNKTTANYDNQGRVVGRTYPEGNAVSFGYDARSNPTERRVIAKPGSGYADIVTSATYPTSCTTTNAAVCNKPLTERDGRGNVTNYTWDTPSGLLTRVLAPADPASVRPRTDYCYSTFGALKLLTGRVDKVSATKDRVTTYSYNTGNYFTPQSVTIDPMVSLSPTCGTVTKFSALNLTTAFTFDVFGNIDEVNGPRTDVADVTNSDFDAMRRLTRVAAHGQITRNEYDANGRLHKVRRARVINPNETSIIESQWQTETRDYWPTGVIRTVTDADNNVVRHDYDSADREVLVTDPDGRRVGTVYDLAGRPMCTWKGWNSAAAPEDCTWDPIAYEANGNDGPFRYVSYEYTQNGKQRRIRDANNNITDYGYDGHDRMMFALFPGATSGVPCTVPSIITGNTNPSCNGTGSPTATYEKYTYDANGNRLTLRTRMNRTITWTYDRLNRVRTKAAHGLPTVTSTYNLLNEPLLLNSPANASYPQHTVAYDYDDAGRKSFEDNLLNGATRRVTYAYDPAGNRTATIWPDTYRVNYTYDALNRMDSVWEGPVGTGVKLAQYSYNELSQRESLQYANQPNNLTTYTYEPEGHLNVLTHSIVNASAPTDISLDYDRNRSGQITRIRASDNFYLPSPAGAFSTAYTPDKLNRYTDVGGQALTYDNNGNLRTWYQDDVPQTYTYDSENRLRTAATDGTTTPSITYDYDALGRRLSKIVSGVGSTYYLLDGDEEIAEYDSAGNVLRRYITGPAIDDRIARVEGSGLSNPPKFFYRVNHQGSVINMTDASGNSTQQLAYDEYGNLTSERPPASVYGEQFRYTGRRFDEETDLYYYRARYYSPVLGRFLQTDPIGYEDDFNLYAYVRNDPLNKTDPHGRDCRSNDGTTTCDIQVTGSRIPKTISFSTPAGVSGTQKSSSATQHSYNYRTPHTKSDRAVQQSMVNDPTPGNGDKPATPEGTPNNATPDGGRGALTKLGGVLGNDAKSPVMTYSMTDKSGNTWIINVTQPGHGLHFGYVLRGSVDGVAMSIGEGWGLAQKVPILSGYINDVWIQQNQVNIDNAH